MYCRFKNGVIVKIISVGGRVLTEPFGCSNDAPKHVGCIFVALIVPYKLRIFSLVNKFMPSQSSYRTLYIFKEGEVHEITAC